jgi:ferredoxin
VRGQGAAGRVLRAGGAAHFLVVRSDRLVPCAPCLAGACGGETACSTCHIIVSKEVFDALPEMSEAEEDMLDLAAGLTDTSRLGCQVFASAELDGAEIIMPKEVNNMLGKD